MSSTHHSYRHRLAVAVREPTLLAALSETLAQHELTVTNDGETTMLLLRSGPHPELLLLEHRAPGLDGLSILERLRAEPLTRSIPVLLVAPGVSPDDETRAFDLGAVDVVTRPEHPGLLSGHVHRTLELVTDRQSLATRTARLEATVAQRTEQLQHTLTKLDETTLDMIVRLSRAAEYKDDDTGAHVLRMGHFSAVIAKQLGVPKDERELILHAAPLHDIGKIGIPDQVLLKRGRLTAEEWKLMHQHPELGGRILQGAPSRLLQMAEVIARTHHERWDGSGYSNQLAGEDIPLVGRIVAVADVFDVLTTNRPYKPAFSVEKSLDIIKNAAGSHFDPAIVEAFQAVTEELLQVKERYKDEKVPHLAFVTEAL